MAEWGYGGTGVFGQRSRGAGASGPACDGSTVCGGSTACGGSTVCGGRVAGRLDGPDPCHLDDLDALNDLDDLDDAGLDHLLNELLAAEVRLGARLAQVAETWRRRGCWRRDGSRSPTSRLTAATRRPRAAMSAHLRRGELLAEFPLLADAAHRGNISSEQLDLLIDARRRVRSHDIFEEAQSMLIEFCVTLTFNQLRRAIDYWLAHLDTDADEHDHHRRHAKRQLNVDVTFDGMVHLSGLLDPLGGEAFQTELERLERLLWQDDQRTGRNRTGSQRRADALVEMAMRSATAPADGRRPRPLLTVLVGEASFARICELASGTRIAPGQLVPLLGEADLETIIFDGPTSVVSVSHRRRFTGALRRAIEVRDRHCAHPSGCEVPAHRCDVDHIVPWSQGGQTSQANGRLLCSTHNRIADLARYRRRTMMAHRRTGGRATAGGDADADHDSGQAG